MACFATPPHRSLLASVSQPSVDRTMQASSASSSFLQFVDIPKRSFRVASPRKASFVRAVSSPHATKGFAFPSRGGSDHIGALQNLFYVVTDNRNLLPPSERRRSFCTLASSASYGGSVEEGLLELGGFHICRKDLQVASGAVITIIFAVANKVLYKMALVPLKEYPFFLALLNTFGYVIVYFSMLYMRYQSGIVTEEMLGLPKLPFVLSGALEALGLAAGMAAAANLPGTSISILLQTFLVWQLALSRFFLKKIYSFGQIAACALVLAGVAIALCGSGNGSGVTLATGKTDLFWASVMIVSCAFQASSTIVKESIFQNASKCLKGGSVDIFVVNSYGSAFQSIFILLMLPFLSQLRGVPFSQLSSYMASGAGCLFNIGSMHTECSGATLLTLSYVVINLAFNISLLSLLKMSSAVVSSLCSTLAVPLTIYMFTLPLPYVGVTATVHLQFMMGVVVLFCGLALYNFCGWYGKSQKQE